MAFWLMFFTFSLIFSTFVFVRFLSTQLIFSNAAVLFFFNDAKFFQPSIIPRLKFTIIVRSTSKVQYLISFQAITIVFLIISSYQHVIAGFFTRFERQQAHGEEERQHRQNPCFWHNRCLVLDAAEADEGAIR